jgi:hypothetical protein
MGRRGGASVKTYNVTIRAIVTKTETVRARNEQEAVEKAHAQFSVLCTGDEDYQEEVKDVEQLKEKGKTK